MSSQVWRSIWTNRDPRVRRVGSEQVRVGAVQAVAHAVVLEHQNFVLGLDRAAKLILGDGVCVTAQVVLIKVVAEVQHHIDVRLGDIPVSVKKPLRVVRARRHRHFKFTHRPHGQRAGAAHR